MTEPTADEIYGPLPQDVATPEDRARYQAYLDNPAEIEARRIDAGKDFDAIMDMGPWPRMTEFQSDEALFMRLTINRYWEELPCLTGGLDREDRDGVQGEWEATFRLCVHNWLYLDVPRKGRGPDMDVVRTLLKEHGYE